MEDESCTFSYILHKMHWFCNTILNHNSTTMNIILVEIIQSPSIPLWHFLIWRFCCHHLAIITCCSNPHHRSIIMCCPWCRWGHSSLMGYIGRCKPWNGITNTLLLRHCWDIAVWDIVETLLLRHFCLHRAHYVWSRKKVAKKGSWCDFPCPAPCEPCATVYTMCTMCNCASVSLIEEI